MLGDRTSVLDRSSVDAVLDKENFTLEELLDEDDLLQECKAVNERLITFLSEKEQIRQLIEYMVVGAPDDAGKRVKFSFIACEIFMCEIDVILEALVEDDEMIDLLFSFLDPDRDHSDSMSRYFCQVVIYLLTRKTNPLVSYIQAHQEDILRKLVDLIGVRPIMEVLIRLLGADDHTSSSYPDSMQWLQNTDVLEMIVNKFISSDCSKVHGNAAETLCAITRYAPPLLASKISSPSFIEKIFHHALAESRPDSVLVNLLLVCMSLLDPQRVTSDMYMHTQQMTHGSRVAVSPNIVQGMVKNLGDLLKLLDLSSEDNVMPTTYGMLNPPFGSKRLKVVEFVAVLIAVSNGAAEEELIRLEAVKRIIELFFEYPYNNFLHHHVERIIESCLESKNSQFVEHLLRDCNLIEKILEAENNPNLAASTSKHTLPAGGKPLPRVGNFGHITRIANKIVQIGNSHEEIQKLLQENSDWVDWQASVLLQRNAVENVLHWECGRPVSPSGQTRDSDEDDYLDKDYDVAPLADSLNQGGDTEEAGDSFARIDEDDYFDDESAEEIISSLHFDGQERASFLDDETAADSVTSSYPYDEGGADMAAIWAAIVGARKQISEDITAKLPDSIETDGTNPEKSPERREIAEPDEAQSPYMPNSKLVLEDQTNKVVSDKKDADKPEDDCKTDEHGKGLLGSVADFSQSREMSERNVNVHEVEDTSESAECDKPEDDCNADSKAPVDPFARIDEDVYIDDASAEEIISSLLFDGHGKGLFDSVADSSQSREMSERNVNVDEVEGTSESTECDKPEDDCNADSKGSVDPFARIDEDFDDESAEEIISSIHFDGQERASVLDDKTAADLVTSSYPYDEGGADMAAISSAIVGARKQISEDITAKLPEFVETDGSKHEKSPQWKESAEPNEAQSPYLPDSKLVLEDQTDNVVSDKKDADKPEDDCKTDGHGKGLLDSVADSSQSGEMSERNVNVHEVEDTSESAECDKPEDDCNADSKGPVDPFARIDEDEYIDDASAEEIISSLHFDGHGKGLFNSVADSSQSREMSERNVNVDEVEDTSESTECDKPEDDCNADSKGLVDPFTRMDEDDYFDDKSAEEIIASLHFDGQERASVLDDKTAADSITSSYPYDEGGADMAAISSAIVDERKQISEDITAKLPDSIETDGIKHEKSPQWKESAEPNEAQSPYLPDSKLVLEDQTDNVVSDKKDADKPEDDCKTDGHGKGLLDSVADSSQSREMSERNVNVHEVEDTSESVECDKPDDDCNADGKGSVDSHQIMDSVADSSQSGEMSERDVKVDE